jgi:hypothetical protein
MSAAAQSEPLVTMFRDYRAILDRAEAVNDDERDVLTRQACDVADRMLAIPAEGPAGALAKLRIYVQMTTGRWDLVDDGRGPTIGDKIFAGAIADLERLVALEPPPAD